VAVRVTIAVRRPNAALRLESLDAAATLIHVLVRSMSIVDDVAFIHLQLGSTTLGRRTSIGVRGGGDPGAEHLSIVERGTVVLRNL